MKIIGVYQIVNIITRKKYIGSSVDVRSRWHGHKKRLRKNKHDNIHLQRAWNKDGENNFRFELIEEIENKTKLCEREQYWMDITTDKYNLDPIAYSSLGRVVSPETRQRLSDAKRGKFTGVDNPFYGRKHDPKTIEEMKKKLSHMMSGANNPFYRKRHTSETKKLLSLIHTGRKQSHEFCKKQKGNTRGAKSYLITLPSGFIQQVHNLTEFCKTNGLCRPNAYTSAKTNSPYRGYRFQPLS
jgi:group I intron endonuclease